MVPELVTETPGLIIKVTPGFIVQVSPEDIESLEVILVSVLNVLDAASTFCERPIVTKIKIPTITGIVILKYPLLSHHNR